MGDAEPSPQRLCFACSRLDIRALLLAAQEEAKQKKLPVRYRLDQIDLKSEARLILKHHPSLFDLKRNVLTCDLCKEIWICMYGNSGICGDIADVDVPCDLGDMPLYIIFNLEESQADRLPKLIVFQHARHELTRIIASFDICCQRGSEPSDCDYRFAHRLHPYSGSDESIALIQEWMETCPSEHWRCKNRSASLKPPTRLLDISAGPRLINGSGCETYAALSYSWGGESAMMLTAATEPQFREKLPAEALPPTMRDAITITAKLNIRYLWIDALCILQDSIEDLATECSKMRDIYSGAVLTINGTSAARISDGLFQQRSVRHIRLPWRNGKTPSESVYLREDSNITEHHVKSAPVNTRGWCLQESLLAKRSLWIGEQQMIFECAVNQVDESGRRAVATEDYRSKRFIHDLSTQENAWFKSWLFRACSLPSVIFIPCTVPIWRTFFKTWDVRRMFRTWTYKAIFPPPLLGPSNTTLTIYDYWREIIYQYTQRQLSHPEDVLPALSGLADAFHRATGEEYVAGAWRGDLIRSLNWSHRTSYDEATQHEIVQAHQRAGYLAPSWSWASMFGGEVKFSPARPNKSESEIDYRKTEAASIVSVWTKPATADLLGRLSDGRITLQGPFTEVPHPRRPAALLDSDRPLLHAFIYTKMGGWWTDAIEFEVNHQEHPNQRFGLLRTCVEQEVNTSDPVVEAEFLLIEACDEFDCFNGSKNRSAANLTAKAEWRRLAHLSIRLSGRSRLGLDTEELRDEVKGIKWDIETMCIV